MSLDKHPPEVLRRALEILGPNGERWIKKAWRRVETVNINGANVTTTCFCGEGAIAAANRPILEDPNYYAKAGEQKPQPGVESKSCSVLRQAIGSEKHAIPTFNDNAKTEFRMVKEKFEAAIVKAEARVAAEQGQATS